ncbi:MAG TPA: RagB/SusD family nutrient uptake outer membrane protein [Bacteroidales bacterium]|nr:RagB/SusD family nutrient uptake outer membrane protein [Bacteroidales bacterium]
MKTRTFLLAILLLPACNEDQLDLMNPNSYTEDTYFTNADQCLQAVNAVYAGFYFQGLFAREYYFIFDLLGNEAEQAPPLQGALAEFPNFTFGPGNEHINRLWRSYYRIILRSNLVFDKVGKWVPNTENDRNLRTRILGEARFLRAWSYFELVTLFGRVPVKENWEDRFEYAAPRADSLGQIWQIVEKDLQEAIEVLPVYYDEMNKGRATKGAAIALSGKALLFRQKWQEAADAFSTIENSPFYYTLIPDFEENFLSSNENNDESVFEVQLEHVPGTNTWFMFGGQESWGGGATHSGRAMEYGWNDWQNVFISDAAVAAFTYEDEAGNPYIDPRAAMTFYGPPEKGGDIDYCNNCSDGALPYPYTVSGTRWKKYNDYENKEKEGLPEGSINARVIRYSDILLMHAEALIELDRTDEALALINSVRNRAGAFQYSLPVTKDIAIKILQRERQLELCGEQHRYFDLIRWGVAMETINSEKQAAGRGNPFRPKNVLLPIPQLEKDLNPAVAADISNDWN